MDETYVHGYRGRENDRLRDQADTLVELLHADTVYAAGSAVLEAGCGVGAQTVTLATRSPGAHFTSIDVSAQSVVQARASVKHAGLSNVQLQQADIFALPFAPHSFDHVFVCFVLEHLSRPVEALTLLQRLLRPGGSMTVIEGDSAAALKTNLTLTGQILDNLSGVASAQFRIDAGSLQNLSLGSDGKFSLTTAFKLDGSDDGAHAVTVIARDAAGNISAGYTRNFTLDSKAPTLALASVADGATLNAASRLTGAADPTGSKLVSLSYSVDGGASKSLIFDNGTQRGRETADVEARAKEHPELAGELRELWALAQVVEQARPTNETSVCMRRRRTLTSMASSAAARA